MEANTAAQPAPQSRGRGLRRLPSGSGPATRPSIGTVPPTGQRTPSPDPIRA